MKVSFKWLSRYVDISGYTAKELAEKLTRGGIEVDIVEARNQGVSGVVVGYVREREKHPDADKLSVCKVDVGGDELLQIVCGAANVAAGQKVPVALVGAVLPDNFKIKRAKLRGVESHGMICSAKELGLNDKLLPKEQQEGILVLPEDTEIGASIVDVLGLDDEVLELDLTPNRSDCLSMLGVAYEVAALLGREVRLPDTEPGSGLHESGAAAAERVSVSISAPEGCSHYTARYIQGVRIAPSPMWLQNALIAAGVRPINNVVDITNYVMLEYGQPLHAFDAARVRGGRIDVRFARAGERLVTLDGAERELEPHMLVIADAEGPIALAGVMGGLNSEVTADTVDILLESAKFAGSVVRRTSRQLGLRSEASLRFEKETDPAIVVPALNRAAALMAELAGGRVATGIVETKTGVKPAHLDLSLSLDRVNGYLGTSLSMLEVKTIFGRLGFETAEPRDGELEVRVPSRRGDITRDVDLIEEIARLHGYDNIPTTLMSGVTTPGKLTPAQRLRRTVRRLLTGAGLHEAIGYSLSDEASVRDYAGLFPDAKPIGLSMPMSAERSVLRRSLIPELLSIAAYNRNRGQRDLALFEIGRVFVTDEEKLTRLPQEHTMLAVLLAGRRHGAHWKVKPEPVDFYDMKGLLEKVTQYAGVELQYVPVSDRPWFHPGRTAELRLPDSLGGETVGVVGQLHPETQQARDLDDTYVLELNLDAFGRAAASVDELQYDPLPRFPSSARDAAVVVDKSVAAGELIRTARQAGGLLLAEAGVFDVYVDDKLGAGKKSVALSFVYRDPERTLTDEEVQQAHDRVVAALAAEHGAELRG
ncbi:phenylalanine--tRNA ligase subunit beta [Paenibacillus thermoaerophilus]|uniref:Phenylalanine--tRNA ligase beta subunit n=1 Tax=Paenibacillus thermoaerophilus TaxID=1215385 RepID=A0ABW2V0Q2_9BACL|nr:phenylalanine--tRNA ligase subunit beta [Paenibacillus thermoaerophilus]TMV15907.1 phenylalanine--tRNA ligase subunit beta [Paenibacillus thermoaerophilus]